MHRLYYITSTGYYLRGSPVSSWFMAVTRGLRMAVNNTIQLPPLNPHYTASQYHYKTHKPNHPRHARHQPTHQPTNRSCGSSSRRQLFFSHSASGWNGERNLWLRQIINFGYKFPVRSVSADPGRQAARHPVNHKAHHPSSSSSQHYYAHYRPPRYPAVVLLPFPSKANS